MQGMLERSPHKLDRPLSSLGRANLASPELGRPPARPVRNADKDRIRGTEHLTAAARSAASTAKVL